MYARKREAIKVRSKRGIGPVFLRRHHFGPEFVRLSFHAPTTTDMYLPCTVIPLRAHLTTSLKLKYGVRTLRRVCPVVLNIDPASEEQLPLLLAQRSRLLPDLMPIVYLTSYAQPFCLRHVKLPLFCLASSFPTSQNPLSQSS